MASEASALAEVHRQALDALHVIDDAESGLGRLLYDLDTLVRCPATRTRTRTPAARHGRPSVGWRACSARPTTILVDDVVQPLHVMRGGDGTFDRCGAARELLRERDFGDVADNVMHEPRRCRMFTL